MNLTPMHSISTTRHSRRLSRLTQNGILSKRQGRVSCATNRGTSGNKNSNLSYQLEGWNLASDAGRTFDSNTMFVLPNGAKRMPDASWVKRDRRY